METHKTESKSSTSKMQKKVLIPKLLALYGILDNKEYEILILSILSKIYFLHPYLFKNTHRSQMKLIRNPFKRFKKYQRREILSKDLKSLLNEVQDSAMEEIQRKEYFADRPFIDIAYSNDEWHVTQIWGSSIYNYSVYKSKNTWITEQASHSHLFNKSWEESINTSLEHQLNLITSLKLLK